MGEVKRLKNRVALITSGDCSVGRRIASLYARHGAKVVLCGLSAYRGQNTMVRLEAAGANARFFRIDVATPKEVETVVKQTVHSFGQLDILCNNTSFGYVSDQASVLDLTEESWNRIIDMSLEGTVLFTKYARPFLAQAQAGAVVNLVPYPGRETYLAQATKRGALISMTRNVADELASQGVRANLIWPHVPIQGGQSPVRQAGLAHRVYVMAKRDRNAPRALARAALYLACDSSIDVTGAMVVVDADYPS